MEMGGAAAGPAVTVPGCAAGAGMGVVAAGEALVWPAVIVVGVPGVVAVVVVAAVAVGVAGEAAVLLVAGATSRVG